MANADLTAERLRELLNYDPETGEFERRMSVSNRAQAGAKAGCRDRGGYLLVRLDKRLFKAHRLAWLYVHGEWPKGDIDHINGVTSDNRISNLRDVTRRVNLQNKRVGAGRSGLIGAHWFEHGQCWQSSIRADGKNIALGLFNTAEEAHAAYVAAKRKLHEGCTL